MNGQKIKKHLDEEHAIKLSDCSKIIRNIKEINIALGSGIKQKMFNMIKENEK